MVFTSLVERIMEVVPARGQPQMGCSTACPVEMDGGTTLEGVGDNPGAVRYRDASDQKGERRSTNPPVQGPRGRSPLLPTGWCFAAGPYP